MGKYDFHEADTRLKSKFGGVEPWIDPQVGWPRCPLCKNAKTFLCQLLIQDLPKYIKYFLILLKNEIIYLNNIFR